MKTLPKPILVTNPEQLHETIRRLQGEAILAVDTESNSLYAYRERVCLIQFSIPESDYLVDPLTLDDLSPLGNIFANPEIEKVFHAAEYDLLVLKRDFGFEFANLFDTMIAARILGFEKVGLGNLLMSEFGVRLEKRFQKADWGKRPFSQEMLNYARMDTHYLIRLRDILKGELQRAERLPLAMEDFKRLSQIEGNGPTPQPTDIWRMNGSRELTPNQATILKLLAEYRRGIAEKLDKPLFKIIGDKTLVEIAAQQPSSNQSLSKIRGMTPGQIRRHGKAILSAVRRGIEAGPSRPPKKSRMDDAFADRLETLRKWRKEAAKNMGVESDVVLPRDIMFVIARENPSDIDSLGEIMSSIPWRLEHFGRKIQIALSNH